MEKIKSVLWTKEEDQRLAELILNPSIKNTMGMRPYFPGRTYKAILGRLRRGRVGDPPGKIILWTPQEDNILREYLSKVMYVRDLYPYLTNRSRNSIIGRVRRLGIIKGTIFKEKPEERPKRAKIKKLVNANAINNKRTKKDKWADAPDLVIPHEGAHLIGFFDLRQNNCRYPYDKHNPEDGLSFMYCGKEVVKDKSYCPEHFKLLTKPEYRR
jgi:hypothetical protein